MHFLRATLFGFLALVLSCGSAMALDYTREVVQEIRNEGYKIVSVSKSWLGRVQIKSVSQNNRRSTVLNPKTGEILRDIVVPTDSISLIENLAGKKQEGEPGTGEQVVDLLRTGNSVLTSTNAGNGNGNGSKGGNSSGNGGNNASQASKSNGKSASQTSNSNGNGSNK